MTLRLIIALWLASPVAIALILCAIRGRHTQLSRTDDLGNQGADWGREGFDHAQSATEKEGRNLG